MPKINDQSILGQYDQAGFRTCEFGDDKLAIYYKDKPTAIATFYQTAATRPAIQKACQDFLNSLTAVGTV